MDLHIDQLFTTDSLFTLQGGALAAWIVPSVLDRIFSGRLPKPLLGILSLLIALGLSVYGASLSDQPTGTTWVVAVLNGFLIAGSSLGLNQVSKKDASAAAVLEPAPAGAPGGLTFGGSAEADRSVAPAPRAAKAPMGFRRSWL